MLIIFKFPYNFFFRTRRGVYSERLAAFHDKSYLKLIPRDPARLVSEGETSKYTTRCQKDRAENPILTLKNAN